MVKIYPFVIFKKRGRRIERLGFIFAKNNEDADIKLAVSVDGDYTYRRTSRGYKLTELLKDYIKALK